MNAYWSKYHETISYALQRVQATRGGGQSIDPADALTELCAATLKLRDDGGKIHFIGNGASSCMASHMALDWSKNGGVPATAYNDLASLTAIGNDLGYDQVFSAPLEWYAHPRDLLVTVSSSGNSLNVLRAIQAAQAKGLFVVTFSGLKPDNQSRLSGDLNFYVSAWSYGIVECAHQVLLHAWLDQFMQVREWEMTKPQFT